MSRCFGSLTQKLDQEGKPICANIDCSDPLSGFDITKKQRFCRKCRSKGAVLRWKCKGCDTILDDTNIRNTRQFCNKCNGVE